MGIGRIINDITHRKTTTDGFLFWITIIFYTLIWIWNPSMKIVAVSCVVLVGVVAWRIRDLPSTLLLSYIITSVIHTGKRHDIIIVPPGIFSLDFYPLGYYVSIIITPASLVIFTMVIVLLRYLLKGRATKWKTIPPDVWVVSLFFWVFISNVFSSKRPDVSLLLTVVSLQTLVVYFFIRIIGMRWGTLIKYVSVVLAALIVVESGIALHQKMNRSPLGKSIEINKSIELIGEAADELALGFRPIGTFGHANSLGAFLGIYLSLLIGLNSLIGLSRHIVVYAVGFACLILTLSRSAWLGTLTALVVQTTALRHIMSGIYTRLTAYQRIGMSAVILALAVFFVYPRLEGSLLSFSETGGAFVRQQQTKIALELISRSPFLGVGTAMSVPENLQIDTSGLLRYFPSPIHNYYLLLAQENGIPALICIIGFIVSYIVVLYKTAGRKGRVGRRVFITFCAIVSFGAVIGFFQPYIEENVIITVAAILYMYVSQIRTFV